MNTYTEEKYILYVYDERLDRHMKVSEFYSLENVKQHIEQAKKSNSNIDFSKLYVRHVVTKVEKTVVKDETIYDI